MRQCPDPDNFPKALNMLYEYWRSFDSPRNKQFKDIELENLMRVTQGRINQKLFEELEKWESGKVEQWKKEGRLSPEGRLLTFTSSEEFLREF